VERSDLGSNVGSAPLLPQRWIGRRSVRLSTLTAPTKSRAIAATLLTQCLTSRHREMNRDVQRFTQFRHIGGNRQGLSTINHRESLVVQGG